MPNVNSGPIFGPRFRAEPGGQFANLLLVGGTNRRDPNILTNPRGAVGPAHCLEDGGRLRVQGHRVERANVGVPLHIGLARQNEDLERLLFAARFSVRTGPLVGNFRSRQDGHRCKKDCKETYRYSVRLDHVLYAFRL